MYRQSHNLEYTSLLSDYTTRNWEGEKASGNYRKDLSKGERLKVFTAVLR